MNIVQQGRLFYLCLQRPDQQQDHFCDSLHFPESGVLDRPWPR